MVAQKNLLSSQNIILVWLEDKRKLCIRQMQRHCCKANSAEFARLCSAEDNITKRAQVSPVFQQFWFFRHSEVGACRLVLFLTIEDESKPVNTLQFKFPGSKVSFWCDKWIGEHSLHLAFPDLFKLARDQSAVLASCITSDGNWKLDSKRRFSDSEAQNFALLLLQIGSIPPIFTGTPDTIRWNIATNGVFTIKTLSAKLIAHEACVETPMKPQTIFWFTARSLLESGLCLLHRIQDDFFFLNLSRSWRIFGIQKVRQGHLSL